MICAALRPPTNDEALRQMQEARRQGAELCELRLDHLPAPDLAKVLGAPPLPVLATVRSREEGGAWEGGDDARYRLLEEACRRGAHWIDVEHRSFRDFDRGRARLVLSFHDFEGPPADLEARAAEMAARKPDLVKIACRARGVADLVRLVKLQRAATVPTAVIAMGDFGEPLRILYRKYGGALTFGSISAGAGTAPGQPTVEDLVRFYRVATIERSTEVFGVIGDPVSHSKSPRIFNEIFRHLGADARYVRIRVDDASRVRELTEAMDLKGLSVTIPHKQAVMAALDEADGIARGIGAANTVSVEGGRLLGANTDILAAMEAVKEAAVRKWSHGIYGMRALVLGAGGVARAIAWGLKQEAARVTIANRTFERGKALAEDLGVDCVRWEHLIEARAQIVVNGTSVGMTPKVEESPVEAGLFKRDMVAMDTVYTPRDTRFLKDARAAGATVIDGVEMFLRQANHQLRIWKGRPIPTELYKEFLGTL
jgi:3-dehydroquinate dehydratase/shikimate dehydrogenase